jgi:hypothetical protein
MSARGFRNALLGGAVFATAAINVAPAVAGVVVDYGFSQFVSGGSITFNGATLGSSTSIDFSHVTSYFVNTVGSDDQTGAFNGESIALVFGMTSPITNFALGNQSLTSSASGNWTKSWNTAGQQSCAAGSGCEDGAYSAIFTSLFVTSSGPNNLTWVLSGTLTLPDETTQPDFLSAAFTTVGGNSVNVSWTQTSTQPVIGTPEPVSTTILGVGLLGIGVARRRRRQAEPWPPRKCRSAVDPG